MAAIYDVIGHELLDNPTGKFMKLEDDAERTAMNEIAEAYLNLVEPAYTDAKIVARIKHALALQINFMLEQGYTPTIMKSEVQNRPGVTTTYRDRFIHPGAAEIVARATKTSHHLFSAPTFGA
jgi:hypothetical protein